MSGIEVLSPVRPLEFPEDWYDFSHLNHFWFRWRLQATARALRDTAIPSDRPLRALDVGCGSGVFATQLEQLTAWTVDGTDLNMTALERCRPRRGRTFYYDVSDERPELLGSYDVLVLFDILEHLGQPRALMKPALKHLKKGGAVLVNVPALMRLKSAYDRAAGHLRRYTLRTLEDELAGLGLATRALRYWGLSLVPLLVARKLVLTDDGARAIERGFQPPSSAINAALLAMMRVETRLLPEPVLGTSVLYIGVKT